MCVFVLKFVLLSKDILIFQYLQLFSQILQKFFDFRISSFPCAPFCITIRLNHHSHFGRLNLRIILHHSPPESFVLGEIELRHLYEFDSCGRHLLDSESE